MRVRWFDTNRVMQILRGNPDMAREWQSPAYLDGFQADERLRAMARRAYARRRSSPSYWIDLAVGKVAEWLNR